MERLGDELCGMRIMPIRLNDDTHADPAQQRSASAVKKFMQSASVVAILAGTIALGSTAWSQSGKPAKPAADEARPHRVGLIDMAHVFKHYKKFDSLREELKIDISKSESQAKAMAQDLQKLQAELKELKEGSPDFAAKEKQFQGMTLEFESFRKATQREILKEESAIYHTVYMEVADAVRKYSTHYGYTLVLRFNREDLNPEDPQGLIQGMNRQVVFHQPEDDMTDSVLEHLNSKFQKANPTTPARPNREASNKKAPN